MWRLLAAALFVTLSAPAQQKTSPQTAAEEKPPEKPPAVKLDTKPQERPLSSLERQRRSIERQMEAIRKNYASNLADSSAPLLSVLPAQGTADCPPVTADAVRPIIEREATRHKLDAKLIQAVIETESAYSPCAVSPVGALGLMQLMPATAESLQVSDPFDPSQNITAGTQFLKQMLERYGGDTAKALAAYNAGPARVDAAGGIPSIPETQEYVRKVMGKITPPRPVVE